MLVDNASVPAGGPFIVLLRDGGPFIILQLVDNASVTAGGPFIFCKIIISYVPNIIPTLYAGYIVSVHRMFMENRPVDPGSIQGSHRPVSFMRIKYRTRANDLP